MKKSLTFLAVLLLPILSTAYAQTVKVERYKGKMVLPDDLEFLNSATHGNLKDQNRGGGGYYDYYLNDQSERVKHGEFLYRSNLDYFTGIIYEVKGSYRNGQKNGVWTVRNFDDRKGKYEDSKYYIYLTFANDKLEGEYKTTGYDGLKKEQLLAGLEAAALGYNYEVEYITHNGYIRNGRLAQEKWQFKNIIPLDETGLPHGLYKTVYSTVYSHDVPIEQERYYWHGRLIYIYETDQSTGKGEYLYRMSEDVSRPINPQDIQKSTVVIQGQEAVKYKDKYYLTVKLDYKGVKEASYWNTHINLEELVPKVVRDVMPSVCEGWGTTLDCSQYMILREQQIRDSIARVEEVRNRPADSAWDANYTYYSLCFDNQSSFREFYHNGTVDDEIERVNRKQWSGPVSDVLKISSRGIFAKVNEIFPEYTEYVNCKKQGIECIQTKVDQYVEKVKEDNARAKAKAARKKQVKSILYSGVVAAGLIVYVVLSKSINKQ